MLTSTQGRWLWVSTAPQHQSTMLSTMGTPHMGIMIRLVRTQSLGRVYTRGGLNNRAAR